MPMRHRSTLDSLEPHELAALHESFARLKTRLKAKDAADEQRIAETLIDAIKSGESIEQAERTVRRVVERI